ncbi:heat shock 70 kDa protein 14-like isoform X2 [Gigantopelta aegis]|uniref:heat shock 70 kDa protein 14-like isoform X2 n=1 Tax=Gigantopelta aegis TaxID=1735272 RepID=UPI001B88E220|nr:heat shock 70 kDa protein 14-like isoform X2 [Gigantopelta aegis]
MAAFGVHFGTCSACLAVYRDGKTDIVANDLGDRVTPCVVAFTDHDQSVGAAAKQGVIRNASNTVRYVKRLLGHKFSSTVVQDVVEKSPVKIVEKDGVPVYEVSHMGKTKQVSMTCIAETIYRKMLETAQSHGGRGIQDAVLTVPVGFTPEQRNAISDAAHKAGFNILRVVSEAAAAVLAYDLGQLNHAENSTVLVYRFGGTSTEATMIKVENGLYRVCASFTDPNFGADEYTRVLCDYLVTEFKRQFRCDVRENKRAMIKLWLAAEVCKHTMSNLGNAHCTIDSLHDGIDYHQTISRARFESLCSSLLQQNTRIIDQCLSESNLQKEDINKVILCGGGSKVPILQKAISDCLPGAELLNSIPADEVIAIGAAKEAAILVGKEIEELKEHENYLEAKCLSKSIYVKTSDDSNTEELSVALPKHSLIPSRKQHTYTLADNQNAFCLEVYEADDPPSLQTATLLAKIVMRDLPTPSSIQTSFHLRRECNLHVTCQELSSNKEESVTIGIS